MEEGSDLMKHITMMTSLAEQLREMKEDISSKKFAIVVLGSLPDSYENFLISMNARDVEKLEWSDVKGALTEEFMKRKDKDENKAKSEALFTMNRGRGSSSSFRGGRSAGRSRGGFQARNSYHPYGRGGSSFRGSCFNCNETGHKAQNCPKLGKNEEDEASMAVSRDDWFHEGDMALLATSEFEAVESNGEGCNETVEMLEKPSDIDEIALISSVENAEPSKDEGVEHEWCVDSGASQNMTFELDTLTNVEMFDEPTPVYLGDKSVVLSHGKGQTRLRTDSDGNCLTLNEVLFVPKLAKNLLSVRSMTKRGAEVRFTGDRCIATKNGQSLTIGRSTNGSLYKLLSPVMPWVEKAYYSSNSEAPTMSLWHDRYGHLNMKDLGLISKNEVVLGMKMSKVSLKSDAEGCEPCALGKMHRLPFPKVAQQKSTKLLEIIHSDLCGPMQVDSLGGSKYVLTFTDDCSRYSVVYFLKRKSEVLSKFQDYINLVENVSGNTRVVKTLNIINTLRSDNGGEYTSERFMKYCRDKGITRQFTSPYCPEQNGVSERLNRTIIEGARSILFHAKLPLKFWAEAVCTMIHLRNRSPTSALNGKTPYEYWFGRRPDVSHLRVFGCVCFVHIPDDLRRKLDPKSYKAIFVGYPEGTKGYKVYNIETGEFSRSRNITFHENKFHKFTLEGKPDLSSTLFHFDAADESVPVDDSRLNPVAEIEDDASNNEINAEQNLEVVRQPVVIQSEVINEQSEPVEPVGVVNNMPRNNEAVVVKPTYEETFMDQVSNLNSRRERKPVNRLIENDGETCCLASLTSDLEEPKNYKQAATSQHSNQWNLAMKDEYDSLLINETWELVPRPSNQNVIGCRWVYKVKRGADGSIDRYKARLVARGYSQTEGVDYEEVFAPVVRATTIRSLLSFANSQNLEVHQMDVKTAFLHGVLDCDLYMEQPEGYVDPNRPDYVCKLNKGIYGLKQAARCWNETLDKYLVESGYVKCSADSCLYVKFVENSFVIMAVYVDDIIPVSNDPALLQKEKEAICKQFKMVDNGEIQFFLGMFIKRDRENRTISISQPNYVESILARFGMSECKPVATPLEAGVRFDKRGDDEEACEVQKYQKAIGCLTYLSTATRPDIAAAVGMLSKFMAEPGVTHWVGVKRVLRYLRGTHNYGLVFVGGDDDTLVGYSDSDWAGDQVTRRSTSGYIFQFGNSTISWSSRRQATVAKSSTEAEYVALSMAAQEAIWLRRLLKDIGVGVDHATTIHEDNQGAIQLSRNPKHHNRTKHVDVSFHFTRERIITKEIDVCYVPTDHNLSDIMTKGLARVSYQKFRDLLGVQSC